MREEGKGKTKHLGCDCKGYCHLIELMYAAHSRSICKCTALEHTSNTTKIISKKLPDLEVLKLLLLWCFIDWRDCDSSDVDWFRRSRGGAEVGDGVGIRIRE